MTETDLREEAKFFISEAKDHWTALTVAQGDSARVQMVREQIVLAEKAYLLELYGMAARMAEAATNL